MSVDSKKTKALDLAITQIDRQFGKGSIMRMGADHVSISENVISTGCLSLDVALGVGLPRRHWDCDVDTFPVTCTVVHPDKLDCICKADVFKHGGEYVMDINRVLGDSVLFALVFRLLRAYLQTGAAPELFCGQLLPRERSGPPIDSVIVPLLELPPSALSGMLFESV